MNEVLHDFGALLESGAHSDVTLVFGGKEIPAHRAILAARSSVFAMMFKYGDSKEVQEARVEITDLDADVAHELLRYIYTGEVAGMDRFALELLSAADKVWRLAF